MSIIGSGDIASVLNDREGAIFFASGVSNSACRDGLEFVREIDLLMAQDKSLCLFYFSSISVNLVNTKQSIYIEHKRTMESLVRIHFDNHCIIRIGNIDWGDNPNTFLNFLKNKKKNGEKITVFNEVKYLISKEELLLITDHMPLTGRNRINVFGQMGLVEDLIKNK